MGQELDPKNQQKSSNPQKSHAQAHKSSQHCALWQRPGAAILGKSGGFSINRGTPIVGWFVTENPVKICLNGWYEGTTISGNLQVNHCCFTNVATCLVFKTSDSTDAIRSCQVKCWNHCGSRKLLVIWHHYFVIKMSKHCQTIHFGGIIIFHPWRCSGPTSDVSAVQNAHPKELRVLTLQFFHHLPAGRLLWMDFRCDFSETVSHSGFNPEPTTFGPDSFHAS